MLARPIERTSRSVARTTQRSPLRAARSPFADDDCDPTMASAAVREVMNEPRGNGRCDREIALEHRHHLSPPRARQRAWATSSERPHARRGELSRAHFVDDRALVETQQSHQDELHGARSQLLAIGDAFGYHPRGPTVVPIGVGPETKLPAVTPFGCRDEQVRDLVALTLQREPRRPQVSPVPRASQASIDTTGEVYVRAWNHASHEHAELLLDRASSGGSDRVHEPRVVVFVNWHRSPSPIRRAAWRGGPRAPLTSASAPGRRRCATIGRLRPNE